MKKKLLALVLVVVMAATAVVGGTMAYLTDEDSDVNVMTLGGVEIKQHEYERAVNADGSYQTYYLESRNNNGYVLTNFTQAKPLYPAVGDGSLADWDPTKVYFEQLDGIDRGYQSPMVGIKNVQDKFVFVENTGKSDAYVRTIIAYEVGSVTDAFGRLIMTNYNQYWDCENVGVVNISGNNYYVVEYVYSGNNSNNSKHPDGIVHPGEFTYNNLAQVYMHYSATNEDVEAIDGNNNGTYDILVLSQAVQTAGFATAQTALDTAFGDVTAEKAAEWFGDMGNVQYVEVSGKKVAIEGEDAAEYLALLTAGTDLIFDKDMDIISFDATNVDAQGATVTLQGVGSEAYGYLAVIPDAGDDVTLSNLNVTGSGFVEVGHWGQGGGNYTVNNLVIEDLASTLANTDKDYTIGCAFMGYGTTTLNNCSITGITARDGVIPISLGCGNGLTTTVNYGEYDSIYCWSNGYTTINGAEVGILYAAPINGTVTIKAGTHIGTLNLNYGTYFNKDRYAKLTVEDGATIDTVIYNDTTYTWATWTEYLASLS